jgi:MoaA/NifB/PqqE/SkfB family radical SAM enzyme
MAVERLIYRRLGWRYHIPLSFRLSLALAALLVLSAAAAPFVPQVWAVTVSLAVAIALLNGRFLSFARRQNGWGFALLATPVVVADMVLANVAVATGVAYGLGDLLHVGGGLPRFVRPYEADGRPRAHLGGTRRRDYLRHVSRVLLKTAHSPLCLHYVTTSRTRPDDPADETELSVEELRRISAHAGRMVFLWLTGGEPFVRPDLPDIAATFHQHNRVPKTVIVTNGGLTQAVVDSAEQISRRCEQMHLNVTLRLAGVGDDHDRRHGEAGLFERAVATFAELRRLRQRRHNLGLTIAVELSAIDTVEADSLYRFTRDELRPDSVVGVLDKGTARAAEPRDDDLEKYRQFCKLLDDDAHGRPTSGYLGVPFARLVYGKDRVSRRIVSATLETRARQTPCYAARLSATLMSDGELHPCEVLGEPIGSLREADYDLRRLWRSNRAHELRSRICDGCFCVQPYALNTNIIFNPARLWDATRQSVSLGRRSND